MGERAFGRMDGLFGFGVILATGMLLSTGVAARTVERIKSAGRTVTVKGYAEKRITSDLAIWKGTFVTRGGDLPTAYGKLEKDLETVIAFCEKAGVPRDKADISPVYTEAQHRINDKGQRTNEIEGYVLTRGVAVTSTDVALVTNLAKEITGLIRDGVEIRSERPQYLYTRLDDLKVSILGEAAADARRRAEELVTRSGGAVGPLRSAQQGVFQITPAWSTEVSDYGTNDTTTIEKAVKAVVTMEFAVE